MKRVEKKMKGKDRGGWGGGGGQFVPKTQKKLGLTPFFFFFVHHFRSFYVEADMKAPNNASVCCPLNG